MNVVTVSQLHCAFQSVDCIRIWTCHPWLSIFTQTVLRRTSKPNISPKSQRISF